MSPQLDTPSVTTAHVPFTPLKRRHAALGRELTGAFERVALQSTFVLGEDVERFEHEFAPACGAAKGVGVASGLGALNDAGAGTRSHPVGEPRVVRGRAPATCAKEDSDEVGLG
jgi:hypothetical protein